MSKQSLSGGWRAVAFFGFAGLIAAIDPASAESQSDTKSKLKPVATSFNWMANGNSLDRREARARQNALRASIINSRGRATWICSPAGFGQKSRCRRG